MGNLRAKELRIGNYVYKQSSKMVVNRDEIYKVENINLQSALKYEPIPLTEEWLLDFGFEKYEFDHKDNQYRFKERLIVIRDSKFCDYGSSVILEAVHQLQNFIFALTNEELKLTKL